MVAAGAVETGRDTEAETRWQATGDDEKHGAKAMYALHVRGTGSRRKKKGEEKELTGGSHLSAEAGAERKSGLVTRSGLKKWATWEKRRNGQGRDSAQKPEEEFSELLETK